MVWVYDVLRKAEVCTSTKVLVGHAEPKLGHAFSAFLPAGPDVASFFYIKMYTLKTGQPKPQSKPKIIVILGPTATGKSDFAVRIAKKYGGQVISADSRQVYIGLTIGTGKITKKEMHGVPHHLLDVVSPKKVFSVDEWKKRAEKKIIEIIAHGNTPIICGGTGFYIQSIVDDVVLPAVPPNKKLRTRLEKKSVAELFSILQKLDPVRAETVENKNPVRLVRAIEIATALGAVPPLATRELHAGMRQSRYNILQIGLTLPEKKLQEKIHTRLIARLKKGMAMEAQQLHAKGLSWKRMHALGLEYRYLAQFLQKKISKQELIATLGREIYQYAKRQMTWFKRDPNIAWFSPSDVQKIEKVVEKFLKKK